MVLNKCDCFHSDNKSDVVLKTFTYSTWSNRKYLKHPLNTSHFTDSEYEQTNSVYKLFPLNTSHFTDSGYEQTKSVYELCGKWASVLA